MRITRNTAAAGIVTLVAAAAAGTATLGAAGAGADPGYRVTTEHFLVHVGPDHSQACDVVGDLYQPDTASSTHRVPAILTTNGFGGSKDDQAGLGKAFAERGYEVLSYSGLGFGGSDCKITLDDRDYDGEAASQLIGYLGGASGVAFADDQHTTALPPLSVVRQDARDHDGKAAAHDPRVGMVGGSYGGEIQFAAAAIDPRLDTIVPFITWNDLPYSLAPNDLAETQGVRSHTPGAIKVNWGALFTADGFADGAMGAGDDPSRVFSCPNFADFVCPALVTGASTGYFQDDAIQQFRHASVSSYHRSVRIPTFLIQGENDTLFNLNEAAATYRSLTRQGTPVQMMWQSWGHSNLTPAPGEIDLDNPDPSTQYETQRIANWFAHYLKGNDNGTGPKFSYFRDWVSYQGIATPAYATADHFPIGNDRTMYLSGNDLTGTRPGKATAAQSFVTPPAGAPTSINPLDPLGTQLPTPQADLPGTFANWTGPTLTHSLDVVGSPVVHVRVQAPTAQATQGTGPAGDLVLFMKVEDVAPDGTASTIHGLEAPVRVPDASKTLTVRLPGIAHRFAAGHQVRLVISGGSDNYRGNLAAAPVTVAGGPAQTLTLPATG